MFPNGAIEEGLLDGQINPNGGFFFVVSMSLLSRSLGFRSVTISGTVTLTRG